MRALPSWITWRRLVLLVVVIGATSLVALLVTFVLLKSDLPTIHTLEDYKPHQSTRVYSDDGHLIGRLFRERRTVVPYEAIPEHAVRAFLAAEDAGFFEHEGLDYLGILRAAIKNLRPGAHLQGASTITQQIVKTMVVGAERSYARKLKEAILSRELEQRLSKEEILHIYLNQIYFGAGAYGVEEAARTYFDKSVRDVDLGEAAYLAAIPKHPNHYTLIVDPSAAKQRQRYVLQQMLANGWAEANAVEKALGAPTPAPPPGPPYLGSAPHYLEQVRRLLVDTYGEDATNERGFTVYTGANAALQQAAHQYLRLGLEEVTKKHGFPGARARIEVDRLDRFSKALHARLDEEVEKLRVYGPADANNNSRVLWDLSALQPEHLTSEQETVAALKTAPLREEQRVVGLLEHIDSVQDLVFVDLGCCIGRIDFETMQWARRYTPDTWTPPPRDPSDVVHRGDLLLVQVQELAEPLPSRAGRPVVPVELVPEPKVQGALVAIDPHNRLVRALVGGYSMATGGFNRATQARRQPGSAFKPILYATAIAEQVITPASTCADTPIVIRDPWTGEAWKPENYEDGKYDGIITYRTALTRSKNTCSVKLIEKVGPEKVVEMAAALGIASELPQNLTLALGTGDLSPLELANAYATFASGGFMADAIFIRKVVDRDGTVLEENLAEPELVLQPAVAYVVTSMMQSVVEAGTAVRAQVLDRPLAGKTGTSDKSRDVWFSGFSPGLVATVWVGFDDNAPLGPVTGSSGALPTWIRFMGYALAGEPRQDFPAPPDVVFVNVDGDTGQPTSGVGSIEEVFLAGTEPTEATKHLRSIFFEDDDESGTGLP